jgi:hypothetical protein
MIFLIANMFFMVLGQYFFLIEGNQIMGYTMIVAQITCLLGSYIETRFLN